MRSSKDFAEQFVVWNFGDAKEESAAYSTGDRSKVAKVSKKAQSERLLFTDLASLKKDDAILHRMRFPCLGSVSAARTMHSLPLCEVFGIKFFVHPPPQPSPTNPLVVPAWLVGVTNKVECATVKESTHIIKCVPRYDLRGRAKLRLELIVCFVFFLEMNSKLKTRIACNQQSCIQGYWQNLCATQCF